MELEAPLAGRSAIRPARRLDSIEISLIRRINALATPLSINLGLGEPNLEPDGELLEMARRAASTRSWRYSPNAGTLTLRERIAATAGHTVDPKSGICVTAGTEEGLYAVIQAFVSEGDEVLLPDPGFVSYEALTRLAGGVPVAYRLDSDGWGIDLEEIRDRLTDRTKAIVVNSPSNPTGGVIDEATLDALAAMSDERNLLLISDEVYREIHYGERPASLLGRGGNTIVLSGLSKSHGATGLRIGWVIAREELIAPIVTMHQYVTTCASVFSQALAEEIFENDEWNRGWLAKVRLQFLRQRDAALLAVEGSLHVSVIPPAGAFYLFVPIPRCDSVATAISLATDAAVLAIPGAAFGRGGEGFLRLSFATTVENIQHGIERIGRFFEAT
ncbi:MAG TPA: pyridoxal phosphate-dependent aminotransferase [Thermoanaerobaculia bacterium]|nr:pyridoxal phosphate-dependent aminotransferase [Thermoanaerobaculia bacterium]